MRMVPAGVWLEQVFRPPEPAGMYPIFPNLSPVAVCGSPSRPAGDGTDPRHDQAHNGYAYSQRQIKAHDRPAAQDGNQPNVGRRIGADVEVWRLIPIFIPDPIVGFAKLPLHAQILGIHQRENDDGQQREPNQARMVDREGKAAHRSGQCYAPILDRGAIVADARDIGLHHAELVVAKIGDLVWRHAHGLGDLAGILFGSVAFKVSFALRARRALAVYSRFISSVLPQNSLSTT